VIRGYTLIASGLAGCGKKVTIGNGLRNREENAGFEGTIMTPVFLIGERLARP
jgi:hypothetical protein